MRHPWTIARRLAVVLALGSACPKGGGSALPPPAVYAMRSNFAGEWIGEVGKTTGTLEIDALGDRRYRGLYTSDSDPIEYVLLMEQVLAPGPDDQPAPSNLVEFTWQDGRGGRGKGWLLINREDSALTGAFGRGDAHVGIGEWTFIRLE